MGKWRYGVILDAGSSGTRIYVYRWLDALKPKQKATAAKLHSLPFLETKEDWTLKTHPGVSSFAATPSLVGPDHLQPLLKHALKHVPQDAVQDTPFFLLATAGMRLLSGNQRKELLRQICDYTRTHSGFHLPDCKIHVQVIPGETEGLYGWVATNYLLGGFEAPSEHEHGQGHHTYGFLDMGGASAQLAFAPNSTEAAKHANDLTLLRLRFVDGTAAEYRVFVTTWLGFGVREARKRYVEALLAAVGITPSNEIPDPCLPAGLKLNIDDTIWIASESSSPSKPFFLGTGKFDECLRQTYPLLDKDAPCEDEPCLLHGVHVPAIDFDVNHFIGISEYWHTTHEIFEAAHNDKAYDFNTYQKRVKEFCSQDWATIQAGVADKTWGKKVDEQTAFEVCFKASWLINVLHGGIGIPRVGLEATNAAGFNGTKEVLQHGKEKGFLDPFQAVNKIKSTEVSWTLGKMVLYASSQLSCSEDSLPVGFGSNEPGIPSDFQYPGGSGLPAIGNSSGETDEFTFTDHIHDALFHSDSNRRIPGFLLFMLILSIVGYLLCGRERRSRVYRTVFGPAGKKRSICGVHIPVPFRRDPVRYERLLEDGVALEDPVNFELDDMDSDDMSNVRKGVTSGPRLSLGRFSAGMLSAEQLDRTGYVVRTQSRENLELGNGRKSRTVSPTRLKDGGHD